MQVLKSEASFIYRSISHNAREREYGHAVRLLAEQGVIYKLLRYEGRGYRLYMYDVGLMTAGLDANESLNIQAKEIFTLFDGELVKAFIMEEYICCCSQGYEIYYWSRTRAKARLPFVMRNNNGEFAIPQLCISKRYTKSVESFCEGHAISKVYRIYIEDFKCLSGGHDKGQGVAWEAISLCHVGRIFDRNCC